jgi:hypothetical protein
MQAVPHHSAFQYHPPQQQPRPPPPPQFSPQLPPPPPPQPLVQVPQQGPTPPEATTTIRNDNNDKSQRRETFSCRNASRWSLPPPNGDKSKNHAAAEAVDIFEVSNVLVLPSAHFNEVVFSASTTSSWAAWVPIKIGIREPRRGNHSSTVRVRSILCTTPR